MPRPLSIRDESVAHWYNQLPSWTAFVDPGETCGMILLKNPPSAKLRDHLENFYCPLTLEREAAEDQFAIWALRARKNGYRPTLVIEEYRIYPDKFGAHAGKEVPTAECIGAFGVINRRLGGRTIKNPSQVKQTVAGMTRGRGIQLQGTTPHARDAELHMWYYVFHTLQKEGN